MAQTYSQKAFNLVRLLSDEFKVRFAADGQLNAITEGFDSNGFPTLKLGSGTAGQRNAFIRVKQIQDSTVQTSLGLVNSVGLTQDNWGPHVIQIAIEANSTAAAVNDVMDFDTLLPIVAACSVKGARVEVWREANGTGPSVTTFSTASKFKGSFENLQYPLMSTM